jgi:hypothetical protein
VGGDRDGPDRSQDALYEYIAIVVGFAIAMINASIIGMGAVGMVSGIR